MIEKGEQVKTPDGPATVMQVVKLNWPQKVLYSINGEGLTLTADHPVKTTNGWKAIDYTGGEEKYGLKTEDVPALEVGDVLVTKDGEVEITSITASETLTDQTTYNLRLDKHDMFYANGILARDN